MATYRCMSVMMPTSGLVKDATVNTFHVVTDVVDPVFASLKSAWAEFMDSNRNDFPAIVRQDDHPFKVYDLADPEPRAPVYEDTWDFLGAPSGEELPSEIALCISFQAPRVSGDSQRNRRGRMYMGPYDLAVTENGRPLQATKDALADRFLTFIENANLAGFFFVVYSRVLSNTSVVSNIWVDNAWDVQRRRGLAPTTRYSLSIDQEIP